MKLVDILARELTEWPNEAIYAFQDHDKELVFVLRDNKPSESGGFLSDLCYDHVRQFAKQAPDRGVTRAEWQFARASYLDSIQPARDPEIAAVVDKPANPWRRNRGRKTPPVADGARIEFRMRSGKVIKGTASDGLRWTLESSPGDIMQWRYAEPQQDKPMAQTIDQVIENAEAAADKAFDPIALRDEFKRITADGAEWSQKMAKLNERMEEIEAALRAEGFALVETEKRNAD
jgi:hypothetical protein